MKLNSKKQKVKKILPSQIAKQLAVEVNVKNLTEDVNNITD